MNENQLEDLEQFITSTVSQTEERLLNEIVSLRSEMTDGFAGVGEAIEQIHNGIEENDTEVERRLTKLEKRAA